MQTVIDGTLRDANTNAPIPGITVSIVEFRPTTNNANIKTTASFVTGNDGKFHFEFRVKQNKEYKINLISSTHKSYSMGYVFSNGQNHVYEYWLAEQ